MRSCIVSLDSQTRLPAGAGGKARGLQLISHAGLPVPPAWVVLPEAQADDVRGLADELERGGDRLFAVRSSAQDEDEQNASFAGIHETLLGVRIDELPEAIGRVAASALSERARAYRDQLGLPPPPGPCGVIVQEMIPSDCAGIAFGTGNARDRVVLEAVFGLGETAVDGQAKPETLFMRRSGDGWQTEHRTAPTQTRATTLLDNRIVHVSLGPERQHARILDARRASEIASGVERLERLAGRSLDVEWACAGGELWFLQARPATRPLQQELPAGETWTRVNAREVLPDIPSAFARSTVCPALDAAERDILRRYRLRLDAAVPLFTTVHGRPVFNERIFGVAEMFGVSRQTMQAEFGGTGQADDSVVPLKPTRILRHLGVFLRGVVVSMRAERDATNFIARMRAMAGELAAVDLHTASDGQLLALLGDANGRMPREWAVNAITVAGVITNVEYPLLMRLRRHPTPRALLARLVAGGEMSVSARQLEDLLALADAMRAWPGAGAFVRTVTPSHASARYWRDELPADLWRAVDRWLAEYGHRGPFESDVASLSYSEDLSVLARMLFPLVSDGPPAASSRERRRVEAARAWDEVERLSGPAGRRRIERGVGDIKRLMALRELLRSEVVKVIVLLRCVGLELGGRLAARGQLRAREDVWHLTFDEVARAATDTGFAANVAVQRELSRLAGWRRIHVPNRFTSEEVASMAVQDLPADADRATLRGNGISPGIVEGEVRVISSPRESQRFISGAVLVAPATDPAWTPLFARAVGVVVEIGGALSHAGIVAREYGIPCVANIDGVTRLLGDGDVVRIDGSSGVVIRLARSAETAHVT